MGIMITSKRNGFRRAGVAHSETLTVYPDDRFTEAQIKELKAEPMLVVQGVDDPVGIVEMPWDKMNVEQLKVYAAKNGIDLGDAKKRAEILEVIAAAEGEDDKGELGN